MAIVTVPPTQLDIAVAKTIAAHTGPRIERTAQLLTWGADEHILCALAACVYRKPKRGRSDDEVRRVSRVN